MTHLDLAAPSLTQSEHKLITGGGSDPLLPQLVNAINHATQIDIAVSFIQPSGLELLFTPLLDALERDVTINILTSDYLAITSPFALRRLMQLQERGAQCRIFECQDNNSFHMKSYIFVRMHHGEMAEGCAFIGSNNISRTALLDGHEWTLRHDYMPPANSPAAQDFAHIQAQFLAIFQHPYTQPLSRTWIDDYQIRHEQTKIHTPLLKAIWKDDDISDTPTPNSIQELALAALADTRHAGFKRGLVVLATSMGKTWIAAFDARQMHAKRVLFVAHREEILLQAEETFLRLNPHAHTG
ncbi:MAG: DEAD/DEAH box helicase family protein, partial [Plesiomonas shigelloides]